MLKIKKNITLIGTRMKKDEGFVQLFYSRIIYPSNKILFARIVSYEVNYPMTIKRDKSQCHGNTKNFSRSITHVLYI